MNLLPKIESLLKADGLFFGRSISPSADKKNMKFKKQMASKCVDGFCSINPYLTFLYCVMKV